MGREELLLNSDWRYKDNFTESYVAQDYDDAHFQQVNIPHSNVELPYNYFDEKIFQFISCYRKNFILSPENEGRRVFLDFDGVMTYATVYVNGEYAGEHKGGYTPFVVEISEQVRFGEENTLAIAVDSREREEIPPFGGAIDYITYGGIYRDVRLRITDTLVIENVKVEASGLLGDTKMLRTDVYLDCGSAGALDEIGDELEVELQLLDRGSLLASQTVKATATTGSRCIEIPSFCIDDVDLWSVDYPRLYDIRISARAGDQQDVYVLRTGFREAEFRNDGFYLNGERLKLRGLNRHQSYPYVGYAMPARVQKKDADILKYDLNLNIVRTSHYPQSPHFLERCDELGLLVFEEIPGWQHIGDEQWKQLSTENVREMIRRDWNHPSIVLWGVRINESPDDNVFYKRNNQVARELDPTRQTGGVRWHINSDMQEDVYTINDFIHEGGEIALREPKEVTGLDNYVPYLVTEFNGHVYPTKRFDQENRLMEHALRHCRVQNASAVDDHIAGAIGWCAFDYNTHYNFGSGDRICYHGVMDMFRIPKYAAHFYKSQISPVNKVVMEPTTIWAFGERAIGGVSPLQVFTNCDYIELEINGKLHNRYYPDNGRYPGLDYPPVEVNDVGGEWGKRWDNGRFIGYVDGINVIERPYAKDPVPAALSVEADDAQLMADGSDTTRVVFKMVDQHGNLLPFINESLHLEIEGPGEIIGPTSPVLIGGCIAVWVKAGREAGEIHLKTGCSRFCGPELTIEVC